MVLRRFTAVCLFACAISAPALADDAASATTISHFSGKPVPRFESLRYSAVNGRAGPGKDHQILWRYERQGLPVLIIKESRDWRRVRDPDGDEVWIRGNQLSAAAHALVRRETVLRASPDPEARPVAKLAEGVLAELGPCDAGWCRLETPRGKGWAARADLWGANATDTPL
ncbi:MAG: SH3 domain-containing protein [Pseudomonadota bacterium]